MLSGCQREAYWVSHPVAGWTKPRRKGGWKCPACSPQASAPPAPAVPQLSPLEKALLQVGLATTTSSDQAKAAWRKFMLTVHPDKGGSASAFAQLNEHWEMIRAALRF